MSAINTFGSVGVSLQTFSDDIQDGLCKPINLPCYEGKDLSPKQRVGNMASRMMHIHDFVASKGATGVFAVTDFFFGDKVTSVMGSIGKALGTLVASVVRAVGLALGTLGVLFAILVGPIQILLLDRFFAPCAQQNNIQRYVSEQDQLLNKSPV